ncbi:MAG: hypothetical protein ABIX01_16625 [Chitinophagaceae bacterium]
MQKIIAIVVCWCWCWQANAQPNITAAEYFIDTDPGFGNATSITITTPSPNISDQAFSVPISGLSQGIHHLFIRSKNANSRWGVTNRFVFYKSSSGGAAPGNIVKAEYFFDTDPGFGNAINIPVTPGVDIQNITFAAALDLLPAGLHSLFIRSKNAGGVWGVTNRQLLYKPGGNSGTPSNIVKAEYFFDTDPGFGSAINIPVTPGADVQNIGFAAALDTLSQGIHSLYIRSKNANGVWGITNRQVMYRANPASGVPPANITNVEYFIDADPGIGNAVPIAINAAANLADFIAPINISGLSVGSHKLYIRSRTSSGWSITNIYTFPIAATVTSPFINVNAVTKTLMCARDSVKVSYDATGTYNAGNVFNVELSDAGGSFAAPQLIGTYTGIISTIIPCRLTSHLPDGTGYRVRVSSTNPIITGLAGSDALTIHDRPYPQTITGRTEVMALTVGPIVYLLWQAANGTGRLPMA